MIRRVNIGLEFSTISIIMLSFFIALLIGSLRPQGKDPSPAVTSVDSATLDVGIEVLNRELLEGDKPVEIIINRLGTEVLQE